MTSQNSIHNSSKTHSQYRCALCGRVYALDKPRFRCDCHGFLDLDSSQEFPVEELDRRDFSIWRYKEALGLPPEVTPVSLGEGYTPLVNKRINGSNLQFKLDFLQPSGSFKDRGASVLISLARHLGVKDVVEDSSGNAGAAIAAYSRAAGLGCSIYTPDYTPQGKVTQIRLYGARVVKVKGSRQDANSAVMEASGEHYYASHLWHPVFVQGLQTLAFELWEQWNRQAPGLIVIPMGSGGLLEGIYKGFTYLFSHGFVDKMPRLLGVQAENCAPIHNAFQQGGREIEEIVVKPTMAEGIAVQRPPRARAVIEAIRSVAGTTTAVSEEEILAALKELFAMGLYVEPTSASTLAAWKKLDAGEREGAVLILTGNGLKETKKMADLFLS